MIFNAQVQWNVSLGCNWLKFLRLEVKLDFVWPNPSSSLFDGFYSHAQYYNLAIFGTRKFIVVIRNDIENIMISVKYIMLVYI